MQVVDNNGNIFGNGLQVNGPDGKPKTIGGGGSVISVTATLPLASSGGTTPNITISQASVSTDGYLSFIDWNTFNNKLTANLAIAGATKTKITYDSKGLVTSGADATTADINDSTNKRYVTDADVTKLGYISITQSVDLDTLESDTVINNAKVSNATHTGDATGATALTVVKIQGKNFPTLSAADDQKYPKYDNATNSFIMSTVTSGSSAAQNLFNYYNFI